MTTATSPPRIVSMDQFRGFTVVGMILVNFLGGFEWFSERYPVLEHHNTYFSYADTIMPSFHFAVGFALRLVLLRRIATVGKTMAYYQAIRRNFGLILLSIVITLSGNHFDTWKKLQEAGWWGAVSSYFKVDFWGTLAIIGVTSLWVLPVIARSFRVRLLYLLLSLGGHVVLSYWFNFDFMYNQPSAFDAVWGPSKDRGLDGGPFGILSWAVPQLIGSMAYDVVTSQPARNSFARLLLAGLVLLGLGYLSSCLSMLYPHGEPGSKDEGAIPIAQSPVLPPFSKIHELKSEALWAEPPFFQPSEESQRELNYWLMGKRVVTLPFILCATGYALAVYGLFVLLFDLPLVPVWQFSFSSQTPRPLKLKILLFFVHPGVFRTFGQNPLAAYLIHERVGEAVGAFAPKDAPLEWVLACFFTYFAITYLFVRYLENHRIYLRM